MPISSWEDDPASVPNPQPIERSNPDLSSGPFSLTIQAPISPAPDIYQPGTPEFRFWAAAEAARRGADFWTGILQNTGLGGATWQPGAPLPIILDEGVDLNAFYDRQALNFFHAKANGGTTVFSGESPDVVCHELGHAILDSVRPELFDAHLTEVAAFHESFGDMSAILSALQLPSIRSGLLSDTEGLIDRSSRVSRLAEQLGAAIRARQADAVDPDCLRNAANSFVYQDPQTLPDSTPASSVSSEPHSFSRVFTGAFLNALANMLISRNAQPSADDLLQVSTDMAVLIIRGVLAAPVVPDYYSQVALQMVNESQNVNGGIYTSGLRGALVQRSILSLQAATTPLPAAPLAMGAANAEATPRKAFTSTSMAVRAGEAYGLPGKRLLLDVHRGFRPMAAAAAFDVGTATPPLHEGALFSFTEELFRHGRVETEPHQDPASRISHPTTSKTHYLEASGNDLRLRRRRFDCGFGRPR